MTEYKQILMQYPRMYEFLEGKGITDISQLESIWRKQNVLLRVNTEEGKYVFKKLNDSGENETDRLTLLKSSYPQLLPVVYLIESDAYLMEFVEGQNFFGLPAEKRVQGMDSCGKALAEAWKDKTGKREDISQRIRASFEKYKRKSEKHFSPGELQTPDFSLFEAVPDYPSHNDLNAANVLYNGQVKLIDPSSEGYEDTARDVGRYCASTFFNNYDYFGNNKSQSLAIAEAFVSHFSPELQERAKYYIAESFLSFTNFDTKTTPKLVLKKLALETFSARTILGGLEAGL